MTADLGPPRTYASVAGRDLRLWTFGRHDAPRPAVVFFHGGGWRRGRVDQFRPQAEHLAGRGMVAVLVEYRTDGPVAATQDALAAMGHVRSHAAALGADPDRLVAAGGSAGGHLALATALLAPPDLAPSALVLFNPVTDTTGDYPDGYGRSWFDADDDARAYSPYHHLRPGTPPALVLHGTADTAVAFGNSRRFVDAMTAGGDQAILVAYEGQRHGFFNPGTANGDLYHARTTAAMTSFLESLGLIPRPSPSIME
ncbi:alpha/beta hydrolase [Jiangella asiatica]|uniref:alpha/beta hydrolase n=1 Tax=Jiangella asiatica TaxID=2530372 RepID=UPI0013A5F08C|nr:alpha/beta hydrolase [Jiangella asiatica]